MKKQIPEALIEIKPTPMLPGQVGIFAVRDILPGDIVCRFADDEDDFLSHAEFAQLSPVLQEKVRGFTFGRPGGFLVDAGLDFNRLPTSHYANHSCSGNMGFDPSGNLVALRAISYGEELTYDYGIADSDPNFSLSCQCGSAVCRGRISGTDWRNPSFQEKYRGRFHPELQALIEA